MILVPELRFASENVAATEPAKALALADRPARCARDQPDGPPVPAVPDDLPGVLIPPPPPASQPGRRLAPSRTRRRAGHAHSPPPSRPQEKGDGRPVAAVPVTRLVEGPGQELGAGDRRRAG